MENGKLPYVAATASAIIFGFSFLFTKNALDSLEMFQLLGFRFLLGLVFMLLLRLVGLIKLTVTPAKLKGLLVVALFQPILYFIFETVGVDLTTASESGIIISLIPIVVAFLAAFLLNERLQPLHWLFITASVLGVVLITAPRFQQGTRGDLTGIAALLGAVLAGALYNIYSKKASASSSPVEVTYVMMWVGTLCFNAAGVYKLGGLAGYFAAFVDWKLLIPVFYLGLFSSVGAFFFMNYSLSKLAASQSAVFINITPVVSVLAGVFWRGERFAPIQILGAAIILLGVWGISRQSLPALSAKE